MDTERHQDRVVSIVEDSAEVRRSVMRLLETIDIQSRAYENAQSAVASLDEIAQDTPGCLILDLRLPDMDGLDLLERLREKGVTKPAIIVTAYGDVPSAVRAMKAKVSDFIEKPFSEQMFLAAIHKALDKDTRELKRLRRQRDVRAKINRLSDREQQVLRGILAAKSSKQIALDLNLSAKTIENYRASLMEKMQAENIAHLVTLVLDEMKPE